MNVTIALRLLAGLAPAGVLALTALSPAAESAPAVLVSPAAAELSRQLKPLGKGVCLMLGTGAEPRLPVELAVNSELFVHVIEPDPARLAVCREVACAAGLYGRRLLAEAGTFERLPHADMLCDAVVAPGLSDASLDKVSLAEVFRVLRPGGVALLGSVAAKGGRPAASATRLRDWAGKVPGTKCEAVESPAAVWVRLERTAPSPYAGTREWSHWRGDPGNSMTSDDTSAMPFALQWVNEPALAHGACVAEAAGGRIFFVTGSAQWHTAYECDKRMLLAYNAYNGRLLWRRQLPEDEPTMWPGYIATGQAFYLASHKECLALDPQTGTELRALRVPADRTGGSTAWKWIAFDGERLYALLGPGNETLPERGSWRDRSWWGVGVEPHYGPYGDTFAAIDLKDPAGKMLWVHKVGQPVHNRSVAMSGGRILYDASGNHVGCLEAASGKELWSNGDPETMKSIGPEPGKKVPQFPIWNLATEQIYTVGWNARNTVCFSAKDGKVLWTMAEKIPPSALRHAMPLGDSLLMKMTKDGWGWVKVDPLTGQVREKVRGQWGAQACAYESIAASTFFFPRMGNATDLTTSQQFSFVIRANCQTGIVPNNGLTYFPPSICSGCLPFLGMCSFAPTGKAAAGPKTVEPGRLTAEPGAAGPLKPLAISPNDWPTYRADNARCAFTAATGPAALPVKKWTCSAMPGERLSAPTAAGGLVFLGGSGGLVRALETESGKERWKFYAAGSVIVPPTVWKDRALFGSCDGAVYALEAATGRQLWQFRAMPEDRRIFVWEALTSTWPVGGGVMVDKGCAYAGAGLAQSSGSSMFALDAETGSLKWRKDGRTLLPVWAAGPAGAYQRGLHAYFIDLTTGQEEARKGPAWGYGFNRRAGSRQMVLDKLLYRGGPQLFSTGENAGTEYLTGPLAGKPLEINARDVLPTAGKEIAVLAFDSGSYPAGQPATLGLVGIRRATLSEDAKDPNWRRAAWWKPEKGLVQWHQPLQGIGSVQALIAVGDVAIAAVSARGKHVPQAKPRTEPEPDPKPELRAWSLADGKELWHLVLPAPAVYDGLAADSAGRIVACLENSTVVCLGGQ